MPEDKPSEDFGRKLEHAAQSSAELIVRYLRTVCTALLSPARFARLVAEADISYAYSTPLFYVIVSWLLYAAASASITRFTFATAGPVPGLGRLLTQGMSAAQIVIATIPIILVVRCLAFGLQGSAGDDLPIQRAQDLTAYALGTAFILIAIARAALVQLVRRIIDWRSVVFVAAGTLCIFLAVWVARTIVNAGLQSLGEKRTEGGPWTPRTVSLFYIGCFLLAPLMAGESVVFFFASEPPLRVVGRILVVQPRTEVLGDEKWVFDIAYTNRTGEAVAMSRWACREPPARRWLGMSGLKLLKWSGGDANVVVVPPGGAAWMEYEANILLGDIARKHGAPSTIAVLCEADAREILVPLRPQGFIVNTRERNTEKIQPGKRGGG